MSSCTHEVLSLTLCNSRGGYKQPSENELKDALDSSGAISKTKRGSKTKKYEPAKSKADVKLPSSASFPAPLALPGDDLNLEPDYPPQSFQEWVDEADRNEVTVTRKTIYVVGPPKISDAVSHLKEWTTPQLPNPNKKQRHNISNIHAPDIEGVAHYLKAFYHGLPVKTLKQSALEFTVWQDERPSKIKNMIGRNEHVGLSTGEELVCIRYRRCPDGLFSNQLNLDDLLDVAIGIVPDDAYALLMLVDHDIYEDDDDDFCCGRAYGGSRVAVVSTARYHPVLDTVQQQVPSEHAWPASHCRQYIDSLAGGKQSARAGSKVRRQEDSAMGAAISAANAMGFPTSSAELRGLWFSRACKTASHELGHCFGMDHCTYYACVMQGTASLAEDSRQPPYLCPIDLAKVLAATGASENDRYAALLEVCDRWKDDRMFAALGAWLRVRMREAIIVA